MSSIRPLFFILLLVCSSCASITDRHQYVRVVTGDPETEIFYDDDYVGQGQGTLYITRSKAPQLILKKGNREKPVNLKTHYRWGHSFGGNALLGLITGYVGAPIGLLTDYATGASWEARDQIDPNKKFKPDVKSRLLILPPTGASATESRFLGRTVEAWLKQETENLSIIAFEESLSQSVGLGFDHESSKLTSETDHYSELIYKTKATHLVFTRYDNYAKILNLAIFSPYSEKVVKRYTIEKVSLNKQSTWDWLFAESFEIFPNTVSIGTLNTTYTGCATQGFPAQFRYCADRGKQSPWNFISSLSLTNILHYRKRDPWRVYFRFFPDFNLSYNQVEFVKFDPNLPDLNLDWGFISLGYGPRLSFILPIGELFWEATPFFAMNYTRLYSNNYDKTHWVGKAGFTSQVGLNSWVANHWNLRLFFRLQTQDLLENRDISAVDPGTQFSGGLGIAQIGLSVGYYFHEEKTKFFDWLGLK